MKKKHQSTQRSSLKISFRQLCLLLLFISLFGLVVNLSPTAFAQSVVNSSEDNIWYDVAESSIQMQGDRLIKPKQYRTVALNAGGLQSRLLQAPLENTRAAENRSVIMSLPLPDGTFGRFQIVESPIMAPELAAKFPEIKTYVGQGIDDPMASVRFDQTPAGFHAMIFSPNGTIYIDPYQQGDTTHYISYFKQQYRPDAEELFVESAPIIADQKIADEIAEIVAKGVAPSGAQLRTYRLAVATTGEYTQFHGGTVAGGMAAIVTTMNRVNGIYEREVAVRMVLVANNDELVYTNAATDPYTNSNGGTMLGENQTTIDNVIGNANYDVGHVFSTGGGGVAYLGVPCVSGSKAGGVTGQSSPVGDPFDVDYVAHEMGHQFGANHTQNNSCNRNSSTAYEPGSASTIMGYAGICAPNLQSNSDDYFHAISFDEIIAYTTSSSGNTCPVITETGNNPPVPEAGSGGFTIPKDTPFTLTGSATDPDGDPVTYHWEEFDLGPAGPPSTSNAPFFRSWPAVSTPSRTFPRLSDLVNNTTAVGENLPTVSYELNFRLTARDNKVGGGGVAYDTLSFDVSNAAGPFLVTAPNTAVTWTGATQETVTWDVANTTAAPVSCPTVNLLLSTDGGITYPNTLLANTANDGTQSITVPNTPTSSARVKVECANNIFFDISNADFTIEEVSEPNFTLSVSPASLSVCAPNNAVYNVDVGQLLDFSDPVTLSASGQPTGTTANFSVNPVTPPGSSVLTIGNTGAATSGSYTIDIAGTSGALNHNSTVELHLTNGLPGVVTLSVPADGATNVSTSPTLSWNAVAEANTYEIQIATDAAFSNIVDSGSVANTNYTPSSALASNTTYYWRVRANNGCGAGSYSAAFSFTTEAISCTTYASSDIPKAIPSTGTSGSMTSVLNVADSGTIVDVNVLNLNGTHTYMDDLDFYLDSPTTTRVQLMEQACGGNSNFDLNLDDEAASGPWPCPPTDGGTYQPTGSLSDFDGEESAGTWTLTIVDNASFDTGQLNGWSLEICSTGSISPPQIAVQPSNLSSNQQPDVQVTQVLDISNTGGSDLVWTISEDEQRAATVVEPSTQQSEQMSAQQQLAKREALQQGFLADRQAAQDLDAMSATACVNGMAGSYPCNNVDLLAFMPLAQIGGGEGNDIWGWTDSQSGKEYAIMGRTNGTAFVDISDPENPVYLGNLPTHTSNSSWRDIKVYNNHAFIVSEASGHGMQIFDLTQLGTVTSPPVTFSNTVHYGDFGNAHNIVINEDSGFAYAVGTNTCSAGLHMVNIQNPTSPTNAGCFSSDGYTHDAQCVMYNGPDTSHQGQEICFNSNEDTLTIVNVTNKNTAVQLSRTGYAGSGYTHQGWLTEDHSYFLLDDETDEQSSGHNTRTYIWDVSDLDNPSLIGVYNATNPAIDHNLYIKGQHAYQSNYRAGLRILDLSDIANANLTEAAYFDIYPNSNSASFNGAWSNYPYFDSGVLIVSGIEQGLFILQPNLNSSPPPPPACETPTDIPWASVSPTSGTTAANGSTSVNVTFNSTGLASGTYTSTLCINSNDPVNSLLEVPVELTVMQPGSADINVNPTSISVTVPEGNNSSETLTIGNVAGGTLNWNISASSNWLTVNPTSGTEAGGASTEVTVAIDATNLTAGTYNETLTISSNDPDEATVEVPVTVTVEQSNQPVEISDVRVTNVRDVSFTVSWLTDQVTSGEIHYGTDPNNLNQTGEDLRGASTSDDTHYVLVENLSPNTTYYFDVVSGSTTDDNGGSHYSVTTGPTLDVPSSDTIFGQVNKSDGNTPAAGSIVYITLSDGDGSGSSGQAAQLSALVDNNGNWNSNLGNARTEDLSVYFNYSASGDQLSLEAQGAADGEGCQSVDTNADNPAATIELLNSACTTVSWDIDLQLGWNKMALPIELTNPMTAEEVCDEITSQGGGIAEINRWNAGGWEGHLCDLPFNNFTLEMNTGYFIKSSAVSSWTIEGLSVSGTTLDLQIGWNSINLPHTDGYTAESLCQEIINQGVTAVEIDRWTAGGWEGHICGLTFNNFNIERGKGYFVKTTSAGSVTPPAVTSPREEPEESIPEVGVAMPIRDLVVSNLRDTSVTLSWTTEEATTGYVRLSRGNPSRLPNSEQQGVGLDIRGASTSSKTHIVVLDQLAPETTYDLEIISGADGSEKAQISVTTAPTLEAVPSSDTIYGQLFEADGVTPATGALLQLTVMDANGAGSRGKAMLLSAIVDAEGYWHANLGNARTADLSAPFNYSAQGDQLLIEVQGLDGNRATLTVDTADDAQAPDITLSTPTAVSVATYSAARASTPWQGGLLLITWLLAAAGWWSRKK